ncbi:M48 family metalloprotease [Elusimicrobiota bacterium]
MRKGLIIVYFLPFLAFFGCGMVTDSIINGEMPSASWSTLRKADETFFKKEDYSKFPTELLKDERALRYARKLKQKLLDASGERLYCDINLLKTARVQGLSDSLSNKIKISRGMLNIIQNEAELACLIGHEIGHMSLDHMGQRNKNNLLGAALTRGMVYVKENRELLYELNRQQEKISRSGWSKNREIEADKFGAELAAKAGYDPYAFCDLFERLSSKVEDNAIYRLKKFRGTHPAVADRAVILRQYLKSKKYVPGQGKKNLSSYIEAMLGLIKIRTGEKPKKVISHKENEKIEKVCSLSGCMIGKFSNKSELFMEETIFQDFPLWKENINIEYKENEKLSNPKVIDALQKLGHELGADKIIISGGDRTRKGQQRLIEARKTVTLYENCSHGKEKGYIASDVRFYKYGKQIPITEVGKVAEGISEIGGIGQYPKEDFTHIDIRPRKPNGDIYRWP